PHRQRDADQAEDGGNDFQGAHPGNSLVYWITLPPQAAASGSNSAVNCWPSPNSPRSAASAAASVVSSQRVRKRSEPSADWCSAKNGRGRSASAVVTSMLLNARPSAVRKTVGGRPSSPSSTGTGPEKCRAAWSPVR